MAKITALSRRSFLRGTGTVAVALPFLEAMLPLGQSHAHGGAPLRYASVFTPNGYTMSEFIPTQQGANYDLPSVLAGIADVRDRKSVV